MNRATRIAPTQVADDRQRAGFSLIEIVAVMGMTSLILASVAVTISSLQRLNVKLRDDIPASARLSRLAWQFRVDVHSALQVTMEKDPQGRSVLRLTTDSDRVLEYRADQERVARVVRGGTQPEHRESFQLPRECRVDWLVEAESKSLVSLVIQRPVGKISGAADDLQTTTITAAVGWSHTFEKDTVSSLNGKPKASVSSEAH